MSKVKKREKYLNRIIPELSSGSVPEKRRGTRGAGSEASRDRDYQVELRRVSVEGFSEKEELLQIPEEKEFFIAVYMRDVTELNAYIRENEEQRMIAGLIYIDNYDEVMESVEEVRQSLLVALIDRKINKYIGDVDGIVKKMEKDKYFVVIRKESYRKIKEDKFSILEEVKQVNIGNARSATLSIGLGLNTATYALSYQYARVAIDLALAQRRRSGGNQGLQRYYLFRRKEGADLQEYPCKSPRQSGGAERVYRNQRPGYCDGTQDCGSGFLRSMYGNLSGCGESGEKGSYCN